jgi:hypothetical protein
MNADVGPPLTRFDFTNGSLRGSHFTLHSGCLVHRGETHHETLPLDRLASVRVAFERDLHRIGWGVGLVVLALIVFLVAGPLAQLAAGAAAEVGTAGHEVARALHAVFRFLWFLARLLPFVAFLCALGGVGLAALGWLGNTTLTLDLAGSQRAYAVRGRNAGLLDFSEALSERLMALRR